MPPVRKYPPTQKQLAKQLSGNFPFSPRYPYLIPVGIQWLMPVQTTWNNGKNCSVQAIINRRAVFTYNMIGSICRRLMWLDTTIKTVRKRYDVRIYMEMLGFKNKAGNKPRPGDKTVCAYMTSHKGKLINMVGRNKEACDHYNRALGYVRLRDAYMAYYYSKKVGMLKKSLAPTGRIRIRTTGTNFKDTTNPQFLLKTYFS